MADQQLDSEKIDITARNIGGIDEASLQFSSGVTALVGENATNRTSLIQAIAAILGTDSYTLKSDADMGEVTLTVGDETHVRKIRRDNGRIRTEGNPYLDTPDIAELYAVLLESNRVRRAVRRDRDLRELILYPIDTEEINAEISERVDERRRVDKELDRLEKLEDELTEFEAKRRHKRDEREKIEEKLEAKRAKLDTTEQDRDDHDRSGIERKLETKLDQLHEARTELERVDANLEGEQKSLQSLRENRATIEEQYTSQSVPDEAEIATLEERIDSLRTQKRLHESTISELQQVIRFNKRLDESESALLGAIDETTDEQPSTANPLDPSEREVTCWTCGSTVDQGSIEEMVEQLQEIRQDRSQKRNRISTELDELSAELDTLKSQQEEYAELKSKLEDLNEKIDRREENIAELRDRRTKLQENVEELESTVEDLQDTQQDELLELQQEVSELEFRAEQLDDEIATLDAKIEEIQQDLDTRDELERRREVLSEELRELRTRIQRIETEAIEEFNTHMDALIEKLGYDNIGRIWIERTESEVKRGREKVTEKRFELHVVRQNEAGQVYEDSLDHLSESEREIVGLVVALAGYIVHDVHEKSPFMLLDSIEMIDGNRLADLVSYLEEYVPYLVIVLLPDHAQAFENRSSVDNQEIIEI